MGKKKIVQHKGDTGAGARVATIAAKPIKALKKGKKIDAVRMYVTSTYNNTMLTVTDKEGNVITWASAGSLGYSGPKKATPFVASKIVSVIAEKLRPFSIGSVEVYVRGVGSGRDATLRSLVASGFRVTLMKDVTPIPHNGPRPKKVRRV